MNIHITTRLSADHIPTRDRRPRLILWEAENRSAFTSIEVSWFARVSAAVANERLAQVAQVSSGQDNALLDIIPQCDDNRLAIQWLYRACPRSSSVHAKGARRCRQQVPIRP